MICPARSPVPMKPTVIRPFGPAGRACCACCCRVSAITSWANQAGRPAPRVRPVMERARKPRRERFPLSSMVPLLQKKLGICHKEDPMRAPLEEQKENAVQIEMFRPGGKLCGSQRLKGRESKATFVFLPSLSAKEPLVAPEQEE